MTPLADVVSGLILGAPTPFTLPACARPRRRSTGQGARIDLTTRAIGVVDAAKRLAQVRLRRRVLASAKVRYREPEQLRHTFASTMLSRNAPLLYVQGQGGWRSASVLLRVYARWMPDASAA